ncbi:RagB/SusD family nutrient uptake outer membrane protein [Flammeovirga kamogawensis]|uniref:RagB/SusD family nutrient uptake outer membrane protein n=1 Tax=Flammeovirga kamogawensis TaxID=373891 RepID=A0ABX8H3I0_9BACT|nr:RagB/SusD family nutrient uptake outer membrane protein [Flammeovirga kamogawensis]MBB6460169.1 hypothetical protein [Flammeovirga kamogawensis]QWG09981.1 RagB/SusD family nutrient uptake outer membrane protein [Flammeovirga kamogawensis]TRX65489.1 RagB/SusD family nutrient uptake outer membrane protein [Flammeovirga kamogawensis]
MKSKYILLSILLSTSVFQACDKKLDVVPDNRVELNSIEKINEVLTKAYSNKDARFTEYASDNSAFIRSGSYNEGVHDSFIFNYDYRDEDYTSPVALWKSHYNAIAHANQVIVSALEFTPKNSDEKERIKNIIAEAKITRAYWHFKLLEIFCLPFEQSNLSSKGIPYANKPEVSSDISYSRETMKATIAHIEKDLIEGLIDLDGSNHSAPKYHFNRKSAQAFASRFYLYQKKYQKVIEYSDKALGNNFVLKDYKMKMKEPSFSAHGIFFNDSNDPSNLLLTKVISIRNRVLLYYPYMQIKDKLFKKNIPTVAKGSIMDSREPLGIKKGYDVTLSLKFIEVFEKESAFATSGYPTYVMSVLRNEEVILNRIEAQLMLNGNLQSSMNDINAILTNSLYENGKDPRAYTSNLTQADVITFMDTKYPEYTSLTTKDKLLVFVLEERRKEFFDEDQRFFDLKRYSNKSELKDYVTINHIDGEGKKYTLAAGDKKWAYQLPQIAIEKGIDKN